MYVCSHVTDKTAEVIRLLLIGDPYISIRFEGQRSKVNAAGTKREILNFHLLAWVSKSIECPQDDDDDDDNEGNFSRPNVVTFVRDCVSWLVLIPYVFELNVLLLCMFVYC